MELTEKQQFWKTHIDAAAEFEGNQADYARLHNLDIKQLYFFKATLRKKGLVAAKDEFVRVTPPSPSMRSEVQVMLPNGVRLSLLDAPGVLERLARL